MFHLDLLLYAILAFSTALTTSTFLLFFSSLSFLDSLSIGLMNHNQIKKLIKRVQSTTVKEDPIDDNKLPNIKGGAKTQNKIEAKLKIAKELLNK